MEKLTFLDRLNKWAKRSVTLKLFIIGFLILLLLIPVSLVTSLIWERENIRDSAIREVSDKWGQNQTVAGPVISIPYQSLVEGTNDKMQVVNGYIHILPDEINIDGAINPQKRYRGIYAVVLYQTDLKVEGKFGPFNFEGLGVPYEDLQLENALLTLGISDMKGINEAIPIRLNNQTYQFGPGTITKDILAAGANISINLNDFAEGFNFDFALNLNGSTDLYFTPFGKTTKVQLRSEWANPSFEGAFLPDSRSVDAAGFQANWEVLQLNRNYPQQGKGNFIRGNPNNRFSEAVHEPTSNGVARSATNAFGVKLLLPIDEYQKTMRSAKYATYFVFITFLTFFFIEVLNNKRVHPIQYLLVGAAIILFYILLLSISEHFNFNWAYLVACVIILTLITFYSRAILKNNKLSWMVFGILAILYGFFYSILQLQDYALLLGSLGLLLILATIMYLTRNIDWYDLAEEE